MKKRIIEVLGKHQGLLFVFMLAATAVLPYAFGKYGLFLLALLCLVYGKATGDIE